MRNHIHIAYLDQWQEPLLRQLDQLLARPEHDATWVAVSTGQDEQLPASVARLVQEGRLAVVRGAGGATSARERRGLNQRTPTWLPTWGPLPRSITASRGTLTDQKDGPQP